ncbi:MAG TPA: hypothetical protein VNW50_10925 [Streptosporangiaceae bacterium]|nr:hypothetical protein [Streptosporangiaceae bacterium]
MLHRSKATLAVAAAAGTVCALAAAGAAMATPTSPWSQHNPAVPNAFTNTTPALSAIDVNGLQGTFLAWKGQFDNKVKYKIRINGKWHATKVIPGAATNTSPSAALFATNKGREAVFVAWKTIGGGGLSAIKYTDGVVANNGAINWAKPVVMPGGKYSETSASPAALFPVNAKNSRVIVAYRGPFNHVRVEIGTESGPNGRKFTWGTKTVKSAWISGGTKTEPTTTSAQPALTEILGAGGNGTVYVFWKGLPNTAPISYATTPDSAGTGLDGGATLTWTLAGRVTDSAGIGGLAQTTGSPAVASADIHGDGPLLLAYKGPSGFHIRYQTLAGGVWSSHLFVGGNNNTTALGPALVHGTLANVSRTDGRIFLHQYLAG